VSARLDGEVVFKHLDDREIRCRLAVRHRSALGDSAATGVLGMRELPEQPRLPDARLADDGNELAAAAPRELERLVELMHLARSTDELRESACCRGLQPRA